MCLGCEVIKAKNISKDDEFSAKLDCVEKIIYKVYANNIDHDIKFLFLRDIHLICDNQMNSMNVNRRLIYEKFFYLQFYEGENAITIIDSLLSKGELVVLSTRFDLLPMYACYYNSDKKINTNHSVLLIASDKQYVYFIEDYYMLKVDKIINCSFNKIVYKMDKEELKLGLDVVAHIATIDVNRANIIVNNSVEELVQFMQFIIDSYYNKVHQNQDKFIGRGVIERLIEKLDNEGDKILENDFFDNGFTVYLMAEKRNILKNNIISYISEDNIAKENTINSLLDENVINLFCQELNQIFNIPTFSLKENQNIKKIVENCIDYFAS